jgi:hypothetical protein
MTPDVRDCPRAEVSHAFPHGSGLLDAAKAPRKRAFLIGRAKCSAAWPTGSYNSLDLI